MRVMELRTWLSNQGLSVREFALELEVPLKTAQDWVYRGLPPSWENQAKLKDYVVNRCAHYWIIERANGHISRGVCKLCEEIREFVNSVDGTTWMPPRSSG